MAEGLTKAAVEAMQALTRLIDDSVEAVMDAHSFSLTELTATADGAHAIFSGGPDDLGHLWRLTLRQPRGDFAEVQMDQERNRRQWVSLRVIIGDDQAASCAEGIGMALALLTVSRQFHTG